MGDELEVLDEPSAADVAYLEERIYEFNVESTGFRDGRSLAIFARDARGEIRAGLSGHTWGGTCEIKLLWVRGPERRSGLGSRLLALAEREAKRRGCTQVVLSSHSFQAPDFYRARGYTVLGSVPDYPRGHRNVWLAKSLA